MRRRSKFMDTYFKFLHLAQAVQDLPGVPKLEAAEERLLELLASAWYAGRTYTVGEAMSLSTAGAPATIHRRLVRLREKGLIRLEESTTDLRAKSVVPTDEALDYFRKLAGCFDRAQRAEARRAVAG
jgi:hypothetical protein